MSQQDVIDLFLSNGNAWVTSAELKPHLKGWPVLYRMAGALECECRKLDSGRGGMCKAYRLKPDFYGKVRSERKLCTPA